MICIFTITSYGISGNEMPPPRAESWSYAISPGRREADDAFQRRMQEEGMAIRRLVADRFAEKPKPYSCADSCDWSFVPDGTITGIVRGILARDQ